MKDQESDQESNLVMCDPASQAQSYIATKKVKAFPMSREDAEGYLNRKLAPVKESYSGDGYMVIYPDDYKSWCPKEVFEEANRKCNTYMDRLIIERDDLEAKTFKLSLFVENTDRERLTKRAERQLVSQLNTMKDYLYILDERITPNEGGCCGTCKSPSEED